MEYDSEADAATRERPLMGTVAVVTGASRGIGKGVAIALGQAGATVYVTARTTVEGQNVLPGTVGGTARVVTAAGGNGIAIACDHGDDAAVERLFARVKAEQGRLDILVNGASGLLDNAALGAAIGKGFWNLDTDIWDLYVHVGLRSYYVASKFAARVMVAQRSGLIVNVSSEAARTYFLLVAAGVCKAGVDKMTADMAVELAPYGVSAVSIWPGLVKTERVAELGANGVLDLSTAESPLLSGRAVVALATDRALTARSGKAFYVAELARAYGFTEPDGRTPAIPSLDGLMQGERTHDTLRPG